jgi:hypothetical protein
MEVSRSFHQRQVVHTLDCSGRLDGGNEAMEKGAESGNFARRHVTEIEHVPPRLDDDRACAGRLQRRMLDQEVLIFEDVTTWPGTVQELIPRFETILLATDVAIRMVKLRRRTDLHGAVALGRRFGVGEHFAPFARWWLRREEGEEGAEKLLRHLEVQDVPALGNSPLERRPSTPPGRRTCFGGGNHVVLRH